MTPDLSVDRARQPYAWLTTVGRRSGEPRTVELWFGLEGETVHFLSGGGDSAHWVRNALAHREVRLRLGGTTYLGRTRVPEPDSDEEQRARQTLAAKYQGWQEGRPLSSWAARSFCLAVDLVAVDLVAVDLVAVDVGQTPSAT